MAAPPDSKLARTLIADELFDLSLYIQLQQSAGGELQQVFRELIPVERRHYAFWQDFFQIRITKLDFWRSLKLRLLVALCKLFGPTAVHLVLEGIEIYGVGKYLTVWERYKEEPLGAAVRGVLDDEFRHEERLVSPGIERRINPDRIRNVFLGFNDGLVEILGAVGGFFAAFQQTQPVLIAGLLAMAAGAFSMGAGAFVASSSANEMKAIEDAKARFAALPGWEPQQRDPPLSAALVVGGSYFLGAIVPLLPLMLGATSVVVSVGIGVGLMLLVSLVVAVLSGMDVRKRILLNLAILALAVGVTSAIGFGTKALLGVLI